MSKISDLILKIKKFYLSKILGRHYIRTGACKGCGRCCQQIYVRHAKNIIKLRKKNNLTQLQLAQRLKVNAERYELMIPEGGLIVGLFSTLGLIALGAGLPISSFIVIKNYNMIAEAYNAYNGIEEPEDEYVDLFSETEILDLDAVEEVE